MDPNDDTGCFKVLRFIFGIIGCIKQGVDKVRGAEKDPIIDIENAVLNETNSHKSLLINFNDDELNVCRGVKHDHMHTIDLESCPSKKGKYKEMNMDSTSQNKNRKRQREEEIDSLEMKEHKIARLNDVYLTKNKISIKTCFEYKVTNVISDNNSKRARDEEDTLNNMENKKIKLGYHEIDNTSLVINKIRCNKRAREDDIECNISKKIKETNIDESGSMASNNSIKRQREEYIVENKDNKRIKLDEQIVLGMSRECIDKKIAWLVEIGSGLNAFLFNRFLDDTITTHEFKDEDEELD